MVNNLSGMYVLGTLIFALFARGEVQPFNSVSFNQGYHAQHFGSKKPCVLQDVCNRLHKEHFLQLLQTSLTV